MNGIDQDLLARLMALPIRTRKDILEFLEATPDTGLAMEHLLNGLAASLLRRQQSRAERS